MKTINVLRKTWALLLLVPFIFISGCSKDFEVPPVDVPHFTLPDGATLITIADLKARHTTPGAIDSLKNNEYITGVVTANDESGNIYKNLYIQDTSAGIVIALDRTSLYNKFKLGQRIYVSIKGLFLGDYGGMTELGAIYNGAIGRIADIEIDKHLLLDGLPGEVPAAKTITISSINNADLGKLVKLENVHFVEVGQPFSETSATTNRTISDGTNTIILRTSNYATFASTLMPDGTGTVYAILSIFGGDYQLYIRDLNDLSGFDYSATLILNEPFTGGINAFTAYSVSGAQVWTFSSTYGMTMSGYASGANNANEDWLISPSMNLSQLNTISMSFNQAINYSPSNLTTDHTLWLSKNYTSGDPSTATWEQVTIPTYPTGSNWTFVGSGQINFPASYEGQSNVHFAYKYLSSTTEASTWEIKGVLVKGKHN